MYASAPTDCNSSGDHHAVAHGPLPLLEFSGNEAYASPIGIWVTWPTGGTGTGRVRPEQNVESRFEKVALWHIHRAGVLSWHATNLSFSNTIIIGDAKVSARNSPPEAHGFDFDSQLTYENGNIHIQNATIHRYNVGISLPYYPEDGVSTTDDATIVDVADLSNEVNIVERPSTLRYGEKITILKDLTATPYNAALAKKAEEADAPPGIDQALRCRIIAYESATSMPPPSPCSERPASSAAMLGTVAQARVPSAKSASANR
jgi:hypothetical protein